MATLSKKRKVFLEDRVKVIRLLESGRSTRLVAEEFGIGKTQVQQTLKRKAEFMADYENNVNPDSKRQKCVTVNDNINELTWKWFQDASARRIHLSGPLIKERALKFAEELKIDTFKASNGWLDGFMKRHNIVFKTMSGERGDVDIVVEDWKSKLHELCQGYDPKDIFNMDKTGVFFKDGKRTTFAVQGSDCAGGKPAKDRITVALCASMAGEKLTSLVIGKSRKPRCFNGIETSSLPVHYKSN